MSLGTPGEGGGPPPGGLGPSGGASGFPRTGGGTPPRRRRRSLGARPRRLRPLSIVLTIAGFLVAGLAGGVAYFLPALSAGLAATGQQVDVPSTGQHAAPQSGQPFTVLLMGSDNDAKFASDHLLTQSMILVRVVPQSRHITMLSIPRDLYVPIAGGGTAKIDTAYSNRGAATAIATVERDFQVAVDHYVWIGLKGLVNLIDQLAGVDVVTSNPVLDDFYPADLAGGNPYAYQRVAVLPGAQHMNGLEAMEYVRSRHGDLREDFGRSERQQQVLVALRVKAHQLGIADLPDVASALHGQILTDMSITQVADLLPLAGDISFKDIDHLILLPPYTHGAMVGDQDVVIPDWNLILRLVARTFPS